METYPFVSPPDIYISDSKFHEAFNEMLRLSRQLEELPKKPSKPSYNIFNYDLKRDYELKLSKYHDQVKEYENCKKRIEALSQFTKRKRFELRHNPRKNTKNYKDVGDIDIEFIISNKTNKQGRSEILLLKALKMKFGERIRSDVKLEVHDVSFDYYRNLVEKYHVLEPDIVYMDLEKKLLIDIEIDEPYDFEKKSPIHYIDEIEGYGTSDEWRDANFNVDNWFVIRLAEEQIVRQCSECVRYIQEIVNIVTGGVHISNSLIPVKRWTYDEAFEMAKNDYRETYLKKMI